MPLLAAGSWSFGAMAPGELAPALREAGFDGIELAGIGPASHPHPEQQAELVETLARHKLACTLYVADLAGEHLLDSRDSSDYLRAFTAELRFAAAIGAPRLRLDTLQPATLHAEADDRDLLRRLAAVWQRCIGLAGDHGIMLLWEPVADKAFNRPADLQRLLERLQQDGFGLLYDCWHAERIAVSGRGQHGKRETLAGGQPELIARLSGRIRHVHLADVAEDPDAARPVLGEGRLDLGLLLSALRREAVGERGWAIDQGSVDDGEDEEEETAIELLARSRKALDALPAWRRSS